MAFIRMVFHFNKNNTFYITLEYALQRQERMKNRFQYFEMEVTQWIASTPSTLIDSFQPSMSPNEKACAQSHMNIWKHMILNKIEYAFIMEDDACFDKDWKKKLDQFAEDDWDMIMLNASESMTVTDTWSTAKDQYLAAGYVLSQKGAQRLMDMFRGAYCSSDWMMTRLQLRGQSYCYFPWLIIQEGITSFIRGDCGPDRNKVVRLLGEINYDIENYI
jgi:GR25 family glycosyltransferase involved in LPS biosynthesis